MAVEFELKFRATPQILTQIQNNFPQPETIFQMETTYYDTPAGDLSQKFFTLRRRMENGQGVCTLKTPAAGNSRNEFETHANTIEEALEELCKLSGHTLPKNLVPICGAAFTRIAKTVALPDATFELALDNGFLTGGGNVLPLWEAELELKSGSKEALEGYGKEFAKTYGVTPEPYSKFRRALGLAKGEKL